MKVHSFVEDKVTNKNHNYVCWVVNLSFIAEGAS